MVSVILIQLPKSNKQNWAIIWPQNCHKVQACSILFYKHFHPYIFHTLSHPLPSHDNILQASEFYFISFRNIRGWCGLHTGDLNGSTYLFHPYGFLVAITSEPVKRAPLWQRKWHYFCIVHLNGKVQISSQRVFPLYNFTSALKASLLCGTDHIISIRSSSYFTSFKVKYGFMFRSCP